MTLRRREPTLKPGKRVTVRFRAGTYKAELPARVAWHGGEGIPNALGVELQLMLLPALARHTDAQWIATKMQKDRDHKRSGAYELPTK